MMAAHPAQHDRNDSILVVPGFVVVKFKANPASPTGPIAAAAVSPSLARCGVLSLERMFNHTRQLTPAEAKSGRTDLTRIALAEIPVHLDPREVAAEISRLTDVEYAEPRYSYPILDVPDDSLLYMQQSYLDRMNVFAGWSIAKGSPSVAIATIDGGTAWKHEDLIGNLWINSDEDLNHNGRLDQAVPPLGDEDGIDNDGNGYVDDVIGWNVTWNTNDPTGFTEQPLNSAHGTITASLFGAVTDNVAGIAGTSWNCRIMPVCAADPGVDEHITYGPEGIAYAYQNGASIINLSWGGYGEPSKALQDIINAATEAGTLIVAAAGNSRSDNDSAPFYPASCEHVLAVGATNSIDDVKAGFSNYGVNVPVFACGVDIWGAKTDGTYANAGHGTSCSSPLVAGLAGLLKSAHPAWTPAQIATHIRMTSDALDDVPNNSSYRGKLGHGRVNFGRALSESGHLGIEIVKSEFHSGFRTSFYLGDTVALSLTVKNVSLGIAAGVRFTATSLDTSIVVVERTSPPITLQTGEEAELPEFVLIVGTLATSRYERKALIRIDWDLNGNDRDSKPLRLAVNQVRPNWMIQARFPSIALRGVKAVNRYVAWAVGGGSGPAVFRTSDAGVTWEDVTGDLAGSNLNCLDACDLLRAWVGNDNGKIYGTTDGGMTWVAQSYPGLQAGSLCAIKFRDQIHGIALGNPPGSQAQFVLLKTADGGMTWEHLASEPIGTPGEIAGTSSLCWIGANRGWFGTNQSRVWRTSDGGRSWRGVSTGFWVDPPGEAKIFAVDFADSLWGEAYHPYPYLARTNNGGLSWSITKSLRFVRSSSETAIAFVPGSAWVWAATERTIFRSTLRGVSWSEETLFPVKGTISHLSASTTNLGGDIFYTGWAVTDSGEVLRAESSIEGVALPPVGLPSSYALFQNYPNPSNPSSVIRYYLPCQSQVVVTVFNTLGQRIATLQNGEQETGYHEVRFDGSNLASGVYYYRMQAGDPLIDYGWSYVQTRKMLLLR